jgi:outer membrane usher protein FimD/PapC
MDAKGDSRSQHLLRYYMANKYEGDAYEMLSSSISLPLGGSPRSIYSSDEELRLSSSGSQTAGSEKDIYYKIYDFVNEDSHDNLRSSSSSFFGQPQGRFLTIFFKFQILISSLFSLYYRANHENIIN